MPQHPHPFVASATPAQSGGLSPSTAVLPGKPSQSSTGYLYVAANGSSPPPTAKTLAASACGPGGSSQQHPNIMSVLCVNFLIALYGIYPSQN